jgi:hypothetical protein
MASPLVWAGVLYSAVGGFSAAACYGLGFGLGRSSPVVAAIPLYSRNIDQGALAVSFVWGFSRPARYVAIVTSIFGALIMLALTGQILGVHLSVLDLRCSRPVKPRRVARGNLTPGLPQNGA